jgi:hypothetical protein
MSHNKLHKRIMPYRQQHDTLKERHRPAKKKEKRYERKFLIAFNGGWRQRTPPMMMTVMEVMELPPLLGRALYRLMDDPIDSTPRDIRVELYEENKQN